MIDQLVYIVTRSDGQWDDHHIRILGVFDTKEQAQKLCDKINAEMDIKFNAKCPITRQDLDVQTLSDNEYDIYTKWNQDRYESHEFNCCEIKEFILNRS